MSVRVSVIAPVLNEVDFIGYSIMAALPYVHECVYALDENSDDGTRDLLEHIKAKYAHERLKVLDHPTFHPHDLAAYNGAFDRCIEEATGDAVMFLHPDMIVTEWPKDGLQDGPLAWWAKIKSFAGGMQTVITKGRADQWKNIHAKKFGLCYRGAYGSQNEDFYFSDITGKSYRHFGSEFSKYPFEVARSGISLNHYCEVKDYKRRLEKMKLCLRTLYPSVPEAVISEGAIQHPRVTLEPSSPSFGQFEFEQTNDDPPPVFFDYREFNQFRNLIKETVNA